MTASGNPVDLVARILAIGGFAINALGLLYLVLKDRREVSVKVDEVRHFRDGGDFKHELGVTVINNGYPLITIKGYSLDFSDGSILGTGMVYLADADVHYGIIDRTADSDDLPKPLKDGDDTQVFFDYDRIRSFMADLDTGVELEAVYAHDAKTTKHEGKIPMHLHHKINLMRESDDST